MSHERNGTFVRDQFVVPGDPAKIMAEMRDLALKQAHLEEIAAQSDLALSDELEERERPMRDEW